MNNEFLLLAATDMEEVIACANLRLHLREHGGIVDGCPPKYTHQLTKGLETAISVAYSRPFTISHHPGSYKIDLTYLNHDEIAIHDILINARNERYAHTDEKTKTSREAGTTNDFERVTGYTEQWQSMTSGFLTAIIAISEKHREIWRTQVSANTTR